MSFKYRQKQNNDEITIFVDETVLISAERIRFS